MSRLAGKVCVVTGASGGIGAATVQRFQDEGATVVGVDLLADAPGDVSIVADVTDEDEAIALANDTIYGLSGSVWTRDGAKALRVARALETGVLSVNTNSSVRVTTPFGGFKQSGFGRELGMHALAGYSEVKNVFYSTD